MKTLPTILLCLTGAATGAGLGWLLRGAVPSVTANVGTGSSTTAVAATSAPRPPSLSVQSTDDNADTLTAELARREGPMRWLYLLGAADQASAADMPALLRAAKGLPGATRLLATRWAELDPQHMFRTLCADYARHRSGGSLAHDWQVRGPLFETWVKTDREAAIAALNDLSCLPSVENRRYLMAQQIMESDPARGLKLMDDWNVINAQQFDTHPLTAWVEKNPRAAAESVMQNNHDMVAGKVMQEIGKAWAGQDPEGALAFAIGHRGKNAIRLAQAVISEWARRDLAAATAHVSAQGETLTKAQLASPLIEVWAERDPQAVLAWANEHLRGEVRAAAPIPVMMSMAAQDFDAAAVFVAGLDPGNVKNIAAQLIVETWLGRDWLRSGNGGTDAIAKVEGALQWIASLPEPDARRRATEVASERLATSALDEAMAFLNSPQGASAPQPFFDQAAKRLARKSPESAMQWAEALPPERRLPAQRTVLSEWASSRPEAAQAWVRELPAGEARAALEEVINTTNH